MSDTFRELLKAIGSGVHTGRDLTREQAGIATRMMLLQEATPAQIGAFMIAHRIKRPSIDELMGMLDAYDRLGPKLTLENSPFNYPVTVFGNPYDGRTRTAPVSPITVLLLAVNGVPVVLHGADRLPTKYGISLVEIWRGLGVDFTRLPLEKVIDCLESSGIGFVYTPHHFPAVQDMVPYREQIGKRPPMATVELIWSPVGGNIHQICGFVHPPTEERFQETLSRRNINYFTTVKGLEGSCDLACSRTAIIGLGNPENPGKMDRLLLNPRDYNFSSVDMELTSLENLIGSIQDLLEGKSNELLDAAVFNGGFYLWRCGVAGNLESGFEMARTALKEGKTLDKLERIREYTHELAK